MSTLTLTGFDLTITDLVTAARSTGLITLSPDSLDRIRENRAFAERVAARGDDVYGLTTGVGVRAKRRIDPAEMVRFNQRLLREHATGQGPALPADVARAAAIHLLNMLAAGRTNVRLGIALLLAERLSLGATARIRMFGSTGMGDVVPLADLVAGLLGDAELAAGEALPLIGQSSVVTAHAALALHDAQTLLATLPALAALDLEAFAANPTPFHPRGGWLRPYPGYQRALADLGRLLEGSHLWTDQPRHLQAPLSFRNAASVLGAAFDSLGFCEQQIAIELNAHQQNPLVLPEEDRMLPVAHFDMQAIAIALDLARIALAPCLTAQAERSLKLLQASHSGLTDGLEPRGDNTGHGLSELAWPLQAITAEARLLIQPVSAEIGSATQAEGVEDRMTMAALGARRLAEMVGLGFRVAAISTVVACQAIDLRGVDRLAPPLRVLHDDVRATIPALAPGDPPPADLEPLIMVLRDGLLAR